MGKDTEIAWTDHTFNHQIGCRAVSPGCAHCYAKTLTERWGKDFSVRRRTSAANWRQVERWNRAAGISIRAWETIKQTYSVSDEQLTQRGFVKPHRPRVFCASMADWLDDADVLMPDGRIDKGGVETLADLLDLIRRCQNLDFLLLSKRIEKWKERMRKVWLRYAERNLPQETGLMVHRWLNGLEAPPNVWVMWSAEDQPRWDERASHGLAIPAVVHGVSVEPMLERIDMGFRPTMGDRMIGPGKLQWIIFGSESGPKRRPFEIEWLADGVRQCDEAGIPVFVKQDSHAKPGQQGRIPDALWRRKEWPTA